MCGSIPAPLAATPTMPSRRCERRWARPLLPTHHYGGYHGHDDACQWPGHRRRRASQDQGRRCPGQASDHGWRSSRRRGNLQHTQTLTSLVQAITALSELLKNMPASAVNGASGGGPDATKAGGAPGKTDVGGTGGGPAQTPGQSPVQTTPAQLPTQGGGKCDTPPPMPLSGGGWNGGHERCCARARGGHGRAECGERRARTGAHGVRHSSRKCRADRRVHRGARRRKQGRSRPASMSSAPDMPCCRTCRRRSATPACVICWRGASGLGIRRCRWRPAPATMPSSWPGSRRARCCSCPAVTARATRRRNGRSPTQSRPAPPPCSRRCGCWMDRNWTWHIDERSRQACVEFSGPGTSRRP